MLRKLDWYRKGGEISDRQIRDVIAILQVNRGRLDDHYLKSTAAVVGLSDLLSRAQAMAS